MGGVLLLVEYVSYIVPSYVSIYTVSHRMTVAFYSDVDEQQPCSAKKITNTSVLHVDD